MNNRETIIKIIATMAVAEEKEIHEEDILSELGIDSLLMVELIMEMEDQLGIRFQNVDLVPGVITTVKSVIDLVKKYEKF